MSKIPVEQRIDRPLDHTYWRSREQLAESPEFKALVEREFPNEASALVDPVSRRNFLQLMTASIGIAGLEACRRPVEKLLPYSHTPEGVIPGVAQHFASTFSQGGKSYGILVESHEGRPTKIEGNPDHPYSMGSTDSFGQAAVLDVYDADRSSKGPRDNIKKNGAEGSIRSWGQFEAFAVPYFKDLATKQGEGFVVISETVSSPTVRRLREKLLKQLPKAQWFAYDPLNDDEALAGAKLAFGQAVKAKYEVEAADVVASFGSDFLGHEDDGTRHARGFAKRRKPEGSMNRAYVVEATYTPSGAAADHRLRVQARQVYSALQALAYELFTNQNLAAPSGVNIGDLKASLASSARHPFDANKPFIKALAADLVAHKGAALVIVGQGQPAVAHALGHVINAALGARAVTYVPVKEEALNLAQLPAALDAAQAVLVLGGNPVYNMPADVKFADRWKKVAYSMHLSDRVDETSAVAAWHLPRAHFLEAWGDAAATDGTISIVQPLIEPIHNGRSDIEVLSLVLGEKETAYAAVRETWKEGSTPLDVERSWRKLVADGVKPGSAIPSVAPAFKLTAAFNAPIVTAADWEIQYFPGLTYDGRFANNSWLQELPDPMTKLVWDNAALISAKSAEELKVKNGDLLKLSVRGNSIEAAAWILPGQPDKTVGIAVGYGRKEVGLVGNGVGFDVYPLRHSQAMGFDAAQVSKASGTYLLVSTQDHGSMEGRPLVREATLPAFKKNPLFAQEMVESPPLESLWSEHDYSKGHQWGMTIDLTSCTGCNSCMIACMAENNISVVGKDQVHKGRAMHWIRMDRYFSGSEDEPEVVHQPVNCQHCENAPCEQVCPVAATVHDDEGTNSMVYNRCIGTRYCSNNCPYKVRRFNFLAFSDAMPESAHSQRNPNVTVRFRGVMEKCSYCQQRISAARIREKVTKKPMQDGDFTVACAQACPSEAIVFGDINNPRAKVTALKKSPRNYAMLGELNTKPRTTYLARIRNLNPELASRDAAAATPGKEG